MSAAEVAPSGLFASWSAARAYLQVAQIAAKQTLSHRGALFAMVVFYFTVLLVFSRLWSIVMAAGHLPDWRPADLVWYLAITEWVVLSLPPIHVDITADVQSGDIAYHLTRPLSYAGARLAEAAGTAVVRMIALAVAGSALVPVLTGTLPRDPFAVAVAFPLALLAAAVLLTYQTVIGLSALWLRDAAPLAWLWQKLMFCFGGLLLPLDIYPEWLRAACEWTPFAAALYGPGRLAFGLAAAEPLVTVCLLLAWGGVGLLLVSGTFHRGLRVLDIGGG
ncbi:MAG: hypothetical protein HYV63_32675 [Candidatus Schekmanbacteria bacterium]|nr:hypothetical protein [Candidatus Schekmanbacteria bacterium]